MTQFLLSKKSKLCCKSNVFDDYGSEEDEPIKCLKRLASDSVSSSNVEWKQRLKQLENEANFLAENQRFWEAISKWNEIIAVTPSVGKYHEMKAQALNELYEIFPATEAAERAVELCPNWWIAHQTLGRCYLNIGHLKPALKSFSKALHLKPDELELWKDDLSWTIELIKKDKLLGDEKQVEALNSLEGDSGETDGKLEEKQDLLGNCNPS
ncbi:Tetratricopeptide repeat protein 33 [Halotydeus destructor]|nr:Tetratricopeptide repeat protein 33 [Halotydeus destructor]